MALQWRVTQTRRFIRPRLNRIRRQMRQTPVNKAGQLRRVNKAGQLRPVSKAGRLRPVNKAGQLRQVSKAGPRRPVSKAGQLRQVSKAERRQQVNRAGPLRPVSKAGPRRRVSKAGPRRRVSKAGPRRRANRAGPRRRVSKAGDRRDRRISETKEPQILQTQGQALPGARFRHSKVKAVMESVMIRAEERRTAGMRACTICRARHKNQRNCHLIRLLSDTPCPVRLCCPRPLLLVQLRARIRRRIKLNRPCFFLQKEKQPKVLHIPNNNPAPINHVRPVPKS